MGVSSLLAEECRVPGAWCLCSIHNPRQWRWSKEKYVKTPSCFRCYGTFRLNVVCTPQNSSPASKQLNFLRDQHRGAVASGAPLSSTRNSVEKVNRLAGTRITLQKLPKLS